MAGDTILERLVERHKYVESRIFEILNSISHAYSPHHRVILSHIKAGRDITELEIIVKEDTDILTEIRSSIEALGFEPLEMGKLNEP